MSETQERHPVGIPLGQFANAKQFKDIGFTYSLQLFCSTGFLRCFLLHFITLLLAISSVVVSSASENIDENNAGLFGVVSLIKVSIRRDDYFSSKQAVTYVSWTTVFALFFFCNLIKCGRVKFALFDPRRSMYFRRYISLVTIWILSDGGCFSGLVYFQGVYRRPSAYTCHWESVDGVDCATIYRRNHLVSIVFTYVTRQKKFLAVNIV